MLWTTGLPPPFHYWPIFMPATLFLIAVFVEGTEPLARFFAAPATRFLGRLSFAFYLVHFVVLAYAGLTPLAEIPAASGWHWLPIPLLLADRLTSVYRYVAIHVPACLALTALCMAGDGPVRRFLASDAMRYLGRLAFAFYIVHYVVISYVEAGPLARLAPDDPQRWLLLAGLLAVCLLAALALHCGVERPSYRPVRAWVAGLFARFSAAPPAAS